ncbi:hypothetical protein [Flagellimonas flava]|uniref:hypothetical protein n=1 Tax=Flagellimonas flava TaxID=570519 RepID=UPI003D64768C
METALKILREVRNTRASIIEEYKQKLAFAEFAKNEKDIETFSNLIQSWGEDLLEVNTAISELEELKTVAA